MSSYNPDDKERTDRRIDPETEFSAAERTLIRGLVDVTNESVHETDLPPHRAAHILRTTARLVEENP